MKPPKPPSRESERRFATVVFADISGFTAMSEKIDPEELTAVMNRCFEILESAVRSRGGYVDKYMGDCIMALFGVPRALERAPVYAIQAALEMVSRFQAFTRSFALGAALDLHVGINSGLVLAGEVGGETKRDFTVMGDTVNLALRLKDAAARGAIWVGPQTHRYTRDEFEYESLKPLSLKGKEQLVPAFRVLRPKARARDAGLIASEGMISSGLVGRESELGELQRAVGRLREGKGGIVSVIGEAGLGKSRLVAEMTASESMRGVTVLRGAALAVGRSLPFHPFLELWRQWAGIGEGDTDQHALATLESAVARVAAGDALEIVPFLARVLGLRVTGVHADRLRGIEGEALEMLIQKSARELLQHLAAFQPVVVVLEDLHWADVSSIDLLEALLRLVHEAPILFVHVLRPEHAGSGRRVLALAKKHGADRHRELVLEPLSPKQCDALVRNLLGIDDPPHATLGSSLRKADGNPFFIEEVVRSLIDEGAIVYRDGRFRMTYRIDEVVVPGTIQEVIMGRLDRLPDAVRRVIQVASVIGRSFHPRILAAVLSDERQLEWALGYLKKRQLIIPRQMDGDVEYVFKHALGQETIYESILQKTRRELHAAVAGAIETTLPDRLPELYGMLAYHYSRAQQLEQAETYLFKAGDEAARTAASSEALDYFQEAARLYFLMHGEGGDPRKKALLEANIGFALLNKGNLAESIPHFNEALAHLGEPSPKSTARLVLQCGVDLVAVLRHLYFPRRAPRRALDHERVREAIQIRYHRAKAQTTTDTTRFFADTIGSIRRLNQTDPHAVREACGMYAGGAALFSFSGVSSAIGARFLSIAGRLVREGEIADVIAYRSMKFIHHYLTGDWSDAHLMDPNVLEQGLRYGQLWDASAYLGLSAERHLRQGSFADAEAKLAKLAAIADAYGSDFAKSNHDGELATLLIEQRRLDEATQAVQRYYASRFEQLFNLLAMGWDAKIRLLRGEREGAAAALAKAERIVASMAQVPPYHYSVYLVTRLRYDIADLEEAPAGVHTRAQATRGKRARRSAKAALRNASRVAIDRVETYQLVGRLSFLLGWKRAAVRWWERSLAEGERLNARPELARTHLEIGRRLSAAGGLAVGDLTADQHLARAQAIFTELNLDWDLIHADGAIQADGSPVQAYAR